MKSYLLYVAASWSFYLELLALLPSQTAPGMEFGVGGEIFEWALGIIGGPYDTPIDLLVDGLGAALAGAFWRGIDASQVARAVMTNRRG